jgi:hypothetical protein
MAASVKVFVADNRPTAQNHVIAGSQSDENTMPGVRYLQCDEKQGFWAEANSEWTSMHSELLVH